MLIISIGLCHNPALMPMEVLVSLFYWLPTEGYIQDGKFRLGDVEIRNSKVQETQDLDRFGPRCA
jgi:hypothetical protein